eukprot:TRINITY_DN9380_c0_g2_i1.p1 TRINITY_DN9380_c0_g2~~TRINITY_DN9380_c0_g2_i1.p1  ORF type:complete len:365 (+),score=36.72 TRINITY_DN9380_c0_g2_i1:71-1096(+)
MAFIISSVMYIPRATVVLVCALSGFMTLGGHAVVLSKKAHSFRMDPTAGSTGETNYSDEAGSCLVKGKSKKIAFFHVPKTGTSLGNMIVHYVNISLPTDAYIPDCREEECPHAAKQGEGHIEFQHRYNLDYWFKGCFWEKEGNGPRGTDWFGHNRITDEAYDMFNGRFVGLFRDPKQRAISSYHSFADWTVKEHGIQTEEEWARFIEGAAVKMLAGQEFPLEVAFSRKCASTLTPHLDVAIQRLDGFLLAGLMEHFELSVCLFHAKTGGKCSEHDIDNMRANAKRHGENYDESVLNGYVDPYDTPLYLEVQKRFWLAVQNNNLTPEKCSNLCPFIDQADFL